MKSETKKYMLIGFVALAVIGGIFGEKPKEEVILEEEKIPVKKEIVREPTKVTYSEAHGALVKSFAYSLQAGQLCDNLKMRLDTEDKVKQKIRTDTRTGIYNKDYMIGINSAFADNEQGTLCNQAWANFGCGGDIEANLLQANPFKVKNAQLCEY